MSSHQSAAAPAHAPTSDADRAVLLDALRGFALFGILVMNLPSFSGHGLLPAHAAPALPTAPIDPAMELLLDVLFHGKFYTLFALLFGLGLGLQLARGAPRGRLARRMLWLLAFGMVHMTVLWGGDILAPYALLGLVVIGAGKVSQRAALITAIALLLAPIPLQALYAALGLDLARTVWAFGDRLSGIDLDAYVAALAGDSWSALLRANLYNPIYRFGDLLGESRFLKILGVFFLGLWTGRSGLWKHPAANAPLLKRVAATGLIVGLPASASFELLSEEALFPPTAAGVLQSAVYAAGVVPLGLAYAALFALLWIDEDRRWHMALLAPAGRMAFTNYIGQTIVCIGIFYGVGLGFIGKVGPTLWLPIALAIFIAQAIASRWWMAHYRFGPLEWLWRRLTYGRPLPIR